MSLENVFLVVEYEAHFVWGRKILFTKKGGKTVAKCGDITCGRHLFSRHSV